MISGSSILLSAVNDCGCIAWNLAREFAEKNNFLELFLIEYENEESYSLGVDLGEFYDWAYKNVFSR